jgi:rod shape-determining protein MreC
VRTGSAVVSDHFSVDVGAQQGVRDGLRVLSSEALVGTVVNTGTHTARVRLLTDPATQMVVTISRLREGALSPLERQFILYGAGKGRLEIRDVAQKYVLSDDVQTGDVVMTSGDEVILPVPVVLGRVGTIRRDPDNGTLYILDVEPALQPDALRRVYIVQTGRTETS